MSRAMTFLLVAASVCLLPLLATADEPVLPRLVECGGFEWSTTSPPEVSPVFTADELIVVKSSRLLELSYIPAGKLTYALVRSAPDAVAINSQGIMVPPTSNCRWLEVEFTLSGSNAPPRLITFDAVAKVRVVAASHVEYSAFAMWVSDKTIQFDGKNRTERSELRRFRVKKMPADFSLTFNVPANTVWSEIKGITLSPVRSTTQ